MTPVVRWPGAICWSVLSHTALESVVSEYPTYTPELPYSTTGSKQILRSKIQPPIYCAIFNPFINTQSHFISLSIYVYKPHLALLNTTDHHIHLLHVIFSKSINQISSTILSRDDHTDNYLNQL